MCPGLGLDIATVLHLTVGGDEEIDKGDEVGKEEPLGSGVCLGSQSLARSVGEKRREVHLRVATLDGRVLEEEEREVRVAVLVREGELMMCDKWVYEWEERTEGRRQRSGVSYSLPEQTLHASTPAWQSRNLLWPSIPSIRSGTCMLMGYHSGIESSQFHIPLLLLLDWKAELGSSSCGPHFPYMALEGKHGRCDESSMF